MIYRNTSASPSFNSETAWSPVGLWANVWRLRHIAGPSPPRGCFPGMTRKGHILLLSLSLSPLSLFFNTCIEPFWEGAVRHWLTCHQLSLMGCKTSISGKGPFFDLLLYWLIVCFYSQFHLGARIEDWNACNGSSAECCQAMVCGSLLLLLDPTAISTTNGFQQNFRLIWGGWGRGEAKKKLLGVLVEREEKLNGSTLWR